MERKGKDLNNEERHEQEEKSKLMKQAVFIFWFSECMFVNQRNNNRDCQRHFFAFNT